MSRTGVARDESTAVRHARLDPGAGRRVLGVGGNTSCVAIPAHDGRWLLLDAGTGMARLAGALDGAPLRASILLTHLHWDHTHGLPFLPNADHDDAEIDVLVPAQANGATALATMARAMSPPHFPVAPDGLLGTWRYRSLQPGRWEIEGFDVTAAEIQHAGGRTFGYRVVDDTGSLAYLPDHSPRLATAERRATAAASCDGVDVLLHGGGYVDAERAIADGYGHATVGDAVDAGDRAAGSAGSCSSTTRPRRTDAEIAAIASDLGATPHPFDIEVGREGTWLDVGRRR